MDYSVAPTPPAPPELEAAAEFCVVREAIVSAFGLPPGKPFTSVRGDPSLRETVALRPRQDSRLDRIAGEVLAACEWLLGETGVYGIYVGFNSSEVRTESIFNPFAYEIHDVEDLIKEDYRRRHFVPLPYDEKMRTVAWIRAMVQTGPLRNSMPAHWRKLMDEQRATWQPMSRDLIREIVQGFDTLRGIEGFYLRNAAISLSQGIVRASFNCDGTYIVEAGHFAEFVRQNTP